MGEGVFVTNWQQEFTYDRYGNRFQSGSGNTGVGFTPVVSNDITAASNRFISTGSTPVTYDAAGNITQDAKFRFLNYVYDANGRQTSVSATNNDLSQTSVYDCAGQRVQTTANGVTRTMVYDIFGQLVADYNGTTMEKENIYRGGQVLAVYEAASTCYLTVADFVTAFYQGALGHDPGETELTEWKLKLTQAQAQGQGKLITQAQALGAALFTSTEYTNLNTSNSDYVTSLYAAFLQRSPDTGGYNDWMAALSGGSSRADVRNGFAFSLEFQGNVMQLCPGTSSSTSTSANLKYVLTDAQGSGRALMDNSGSGTSSIAARHDYLPFGEEIWAGVGLRTTTQKYAATNKVRQRFAMTERDEATGLDHTWFRKYDSFAGRWTSPDPYGGSMNIADPQSLNRYGYVKNDPVNLVDPFGLDPGGVIGGLIAGNLGQWSVDVPISFDSRHSGGVLGGMIGDTGIVIEAGGEPDLGGGGGDDPQNPEMIPARNLLPEVYHLLDNNRCFTFISNLLNVARQLTNRRPYTYDAYELARTIATQADGGISFYPGAGGGDAAGDIFSGNAKVGIFLLPAGSGRNPVGAQVSYALVALHEFIHLAGGANQVGAPIYNDYRLAEAAKILTGAPGFPSGPAPRTRAEQDKLRSDTGNYWDRQLREHCSPTGG